MGSVLSPVNGADAGHGVAVTHSLRQQSVPDFPGEHGGVLPLVLRDLLHDLRGGHFGLGAPDHTGLDAARLVVAEDDLIISLKRKRIVSKRKIKCCSTNTAPVPDT